MDLIAAVRGYLDRIVSETSGMKALLMDSYTTSVTSLIYSQTEILGKEVYLIEQLQKATSHAPMPHLKAVLFIQPTRQNINLITQELSDPKFSEYHIFFSNVLPGEFLRVISNGDPQEMVRQVQEFFGDYMPINNDLFTCQTPSSIQMTMSSNSAMSSKFRPLFDLNVGSVASVLLSLKKKPRCIRYQASSPMAMQMASELNDRIQSDQIFHFRGEGPMLLILDRMDDPVTPLLSQWTYQAMVHELLGMNNNRVMLKGAPGIKKDLEEIVLSATQDSFFRNNRNANFGELAEAVKELIDNYQRSTAQNENIKSIEDMQNFMERYPQFRAESHNVSKHVAIMGELGRLVDVCSLMDVSAFEQELACGSDDHGKHVRDLVDKLNDVRVKVPDKLRLGLLYALRYEASGNIAMIKGHMAQGGVSPEKVALVDKILRYAGTRSRGPGLYGKRDAFSQMTKSLMTSVQGVSNVYCQHVPLLMQTVQSASRGKLKESLYPFCGAAAAAATRPGEPNPMGAEKSKEIIVFVAGGVTFEEATKVAEFNEQNKGGVSVVLGGSTIHNSTSFLEEISML